jgi:hypothetical protein
MRRRRQDPRQILLQDATRVAGFVEALRDEGRRLDAPDLVDLVTSLLMLRMWQAKLQTWIEMEDQA